jgi:hypothetical protein
MKTSDLESLVDAAFRGQGNMTARSKLFRLMVGTDRPSRELTAATEARMLGVAELYGVTNLNSLKERGVKPSKDFLNEQMELMVSDINVVDAEKAARITEPKRLAAPPGHTNPWHRSHKDANGNYTPAALKRQADLKNFNMNVAAAVARGAGVTLSEAG